MNRGALAAMMAGIMAFSPSFSGEQTLTARPTNVPDVFVGGKSRRRKGDNKATAKKRNKAWACGRA